MICYYKQIKNSFDTITCKGMKMEFQKYRDICFGVEST